jgi:cell division cycle 20, cofactor of APC complex
LVAAADESLKFWKLFERKSGQPSAGAAAGGVTGKGEEMVKQMTIR